MVMMMIVVRCAMMAGSFHNHDKGSRQILLSGFFSVKGGVTPKFFHFPFFGRKDPQIRYGKNPLKTAVFGQENANFSPFGPIF